MALVTHIATLYDVPRDGVRFGATLLTFTSTCPAEKQHVRRYASYIKNTKADTPRPGGEGAEPMPFQKLGNEALDAIVNVRLTSSEKERLKEDADMAGLSMSELVRRRYFGKPIIANADAIMLKELRRIGGLVKHVHNQSNGAYNSETTAALSTLKKYIEKLTAK